MKKHKWILLSSNILLGLVISGVAKAESTGFVTHLSALHQKMIIGQSMNFQVTVTNQTSQEKMIGYGGINTSGDDFLVTGPDGKAVTYSGPTIFALLLRGLPIDAGKTEIFIESRDLAKDYKINRPGEYTVQYQKQVLDRGSELPASNVVKVTVTSK